MRYEIQAGQVSEIKRNGNVLFLDFIDETGIQILSHNAATMNSFQICPLTKKILSNRALGQLLFEIVEERPIKLVMSKKVSKDESISINDISIETIFIAIFFPFDGSPTMFFTDLYSPVFETEGLVAFYGDARARYIPKDNDIDSRYLLKKGYAGGDKLSAIDYPLVFK
jgi:hypothetical protein